MTAAMRVPFGDLARQAAALGDELTGALSRVAAGGWYVLGAEVRAFEEEFAASCGAAHCVGVASGFEALYLALAALGVGPGDEVVTVANACVYQAAAIMQAGARPVFVDSDPRTHNLDPDRLDAALTPRTRAVMPVHLYGRLAEMDAIREVAERHGLPVVEDAAQAHGAWNGGAGPGRRAGAWGEVACFSFYPSKNLGALGDAGALTTGSAELAERLRRLRMYGWGEKYVATEPGGRNSRLDEIQAAALRVKLRHLEAWNDARRERAAWYRELLAGLPLELPADDLGHAYHLFVVACDERDGLRRHLADAGVGSDVHYPLPAHLQPAYAHLGYRAGDLPNTEAAAARILSLPLYPELTRAEVEHVAAAARAFFGQ
ncbi:MAG TPA: DegT/DnrJ/EryC1/StrS family aminotransferase [Chloroflexaceae bacterium]|nr:DegT/DnrJ/EryC1/StrS family aminotransferase [Chloroflexaceae bacterium]